MFRSTSHYRLLLVALVAMAGMVLGAPDAVAGTPGLGAESCCASPMPDGCHCCQASKPASLPQPRITPAVPAPSLSGPRSSGSCECRPAQPAQGNSRQDSRSSEDRSSESLDELPLASALCVPRLASTSPALASPPPLRAALYLRNERLLI